MTKSPEKCNINHNNHTSQKHSGPFYIAHSLFENKRLRQKRQRWLLALQKYAYRQYQQQQQQLYRKTDRRKQNLARLRADITIDLLSDDNNDDSDIHEVEQPKLTPVLHLPVEGQQQMQQFIVYPGHIELSKVPNITLIPVQGLPLMTPKTTPAPASLTTPSQAAKRIKRKRKSEQPKRHAQPTIVNNESIVLSDDSDNEMAPRLSSTNNDTDCLEVPSALPAELTISRVHTPPQLTHSPSGSGTCTLAASITRITPPHSAQVDEEVTVSIVPRSSTAGSCAKPNADELFPMLPDETTVHTVIANRTYELSLTKLREGLASCGIPEFTNDQQKAPPLRRKGQQVETPPIVTPAPTPISLKLSSDLSISLISDDDDDGVVGELQRDAADMLQKQPQLSVQQVQLPAGSAMNTARQPPKRRKLG